MATLKLSTNEFSPSFAIAYWKTDHYEIVKKFSYPANDIIFVKHFVAGLELADVEDWCLFDGNDTEGYRYIGLIKVLFFWLFN